MTRYPRPIVNIRDESHRPRPHCQVSRDSLSSSSSAGSNITPEQLQSSHGKGDSARQPVNASRVPTRPTKLSQRSRVSCHVMILTCLMLLLECHCMSFTLLFCLQDSRSSLVKGAVPIVPEPGSGRETTPVNSKVDAAAAKPTVPRTGKPQWDGPEVVLEPSTLEHRPTASVQGQCRQDLPVSQRLSDQVSCFIVHGCLIGVNEF